MKKQIPDWLDYGVLKLNKKQSKLLKLAIKKVIGKMT